MVWKHINQFRYIIYMPHLFTKEKWINLPTGADFLVKVVTKNYKCLPHLWVSECQLKTSISWKLPSVDNFHQLITSISWVSLVQNLLESGALSFIGAWILLVQYLLRNGAISYWCQNSIKFTKPTLLLVLHFYWC